jgi:arsenate reductase-like glutaredoxin family protein
MVFASKGKKTVKVNLKSEKVDNETMEYFILGRTGNLRAPTIRSGKKLLIGFNEDFFKEVLL